MARSMLSWINHRTLAVLCSIGLAALSIWLAVPLLSNRETPVLRMSAGPDSTRRHAVATYLCTQAAQNGLSISLVTNAGSEDSLNQLKAGQLDVAIVSSGILVPDDDDITVLGALQLEAAHVLVRKDMAEHGSLAEAIRGKRVNFGEKGSTERLLAQELLAFSRLKLPSAAEPGDVVPTEYGKAWLVGKARAILQADGAEKDALIAELPDCLLVVATMPSTIVQLLVEAADYRIVPIPATRAFLSDNLQDSRAKATVVERDLLERTLIPASSYFTTRGYPAADCETIGVRLLVVARKNVPEQAIRPLMKTLFEGEFARRILPKSPRDLTTSFAVHPAAIAYLDRDKPLAVAQAMDWINKGLSALGTFRAGALSLYGLLWRKRARKPSDYYAEIRKLDLLANGTEIDSTVVNQPKQLVPYLDDRLLKIRHELIEDICEGRIKGDQVIANILALLKDARRSLPKLEAEATDRGPNLQRPDRPTAKAA